MYWTDKLKIDFLQRVVLIHSYLYYETDKELWTDKKYDETTKQLLLLQSKHNADWIKEHTQYGYVFYDYDGSTGFDLFHRLKEKDKQMIKGIAARL